MEAVPAPRFSGMILQIVFIGLVFAGALYVAKRMHSKMKEDEAYDGFEYVQSDNHFVVNLDGDYSKA